MYLTYNQSAFRNEVFCPLTYHFFSPLFPFFFKESNWENLGSKLGKKDTILHWEWGRISAPNQADREPCQGHKVKIKESPNRYCHKENTS